MHGASIGVTVTVVFCKFIFFVGLDVFLALFADAAANAVSEVVTDLFTLVIFVED